MPIGKWVGDAVYAAGRLFVDECLQRDGSLFSPGRGIWAPEPIDDLYTRFVVNEDLGEGSFIEKLEQQLAGASDTTIQLAAEAIFFNYLCEDDTGAEHKRKTVSRILALMPEPVTIPAELEQTFANGIARIGMAKAQKWQNVAFLLELVRDWKRRDGDERDRLLGDHAAFREFVHGVERHSASVQLEGLLHLVFPEQYESIVSANVKRKIVEAFGDYLEGGESNLDERVAAIRRNLEGEFGDDFGFYDDDLVAVWGSKAGGPAWLVRGARAFGANLISRWLEEGFVSIGRPEEPIVEPGADLDRIIDLLQEYEPEKSRHQLRNGALTTLRFIDRMAPGDLVLTIDPDNRVYVGRVTGELEWVGDDQPGTARRRSVEWLNADTPAQRADLPERLTRLLRQNTVIDLSSAYDDVAALAPAEELDVEWDELLHWAQRIYETPDFDEQEHQYKLDAAANVADALEAHAAHAEDWLARLRRAFGAPNNLTDWRSHDTLLRWAESNPDDAYRLLDEIWQEAPDEPRFAELLAGWPVQQSPGARIGLLTFLLSGLDAKRFPFYKPTPAAELRRLLHLPGEDADGARRYFSFLELLDELRDRLAAHGVQLRDRVDAQGIVWVLAWPDPPDSWHAEEQAAFRAWRGDVEKDEPDPASDGVAIGRPPVSLADELLVTSSWFNEIVDLLNEKRQVVFYGPPGTGKTFVAQAIARHVESCGGAAELVQFHPAYSYEDFFEGYRPRLAASNGIEFELRPGPLRRLAEQARQAPERPHLLVIDEINRGNIAKIFGELYFLLEYRDRAIRLQYSPETEFRLPDNLFVIGTMNTADRSIALVDGALRRRFYFVPFLPREEPLRSVLRKWLERKGHDAAPAEYLDALNAALASTAGADEELAIGASYFITRGDAAPDMDRVWRHAILPLLEERFYGARKIEDIEREFSPQALLGEP